MAMEAEAIPAEVEGEVGTPVAAVAEDIRAGDSNLRAGSTTRTEGRRPRMTLLS
jgi:hypothetical protein